MADKISTGIEMRDESAKDGGSDLTVWIPVELVPRPPKMYPIVCDECGHKLSVWFIYANEKKLGSQSYTPGAAMQKAFQLIAQEPTKFRFKGVSPK